MDQGIKWVFVIRVQSEFHPWLIPALVRAAQSPRLDDFQQTIPAAARRLIFQDLLG
jgi:hypothetical protein